MQKAAFVIAATAKVREGDGRKVIAGGWLVGGERPRALNMAISRPGADASAASGRNF